MPQEVARDILFKQRMGHTLRYSSLLKEEATNSKSVKEQIFDVEMELDDKITPKMKKLKINYLKDIVENCYPDKHISDDFTNSEQIKLCRQETFEKYIKAQDLLALRASDYMKFDRCLEDAGHNEMLIYACVNRVVGDFRKTNDLIVKKVENM
uniref:Uncharacterized protein n=1 Tax=Strombidium rassoulzadegani TaxID=1082188 RepID=A0A7S3CJK7_9SPIT|mmetsp:Transcript_10072/g.16985  ORF Transcript_10072/g.16985 Transcript_10072/m.16985 type:complete len:153 (+) Transcript_10072:43-501(+)|eukprot:CAMPEP_0168610980 /NCGR_PEP_ID=MMETSP0449_2-20121227/2096_1 /TAXON_ID=1082188 /ORGANISM="Strombidium rassoulzadegani, Strain ras09" /LENGTH=152 /DNA_ID=CAMNT_0008651361 /DNA_START=31 /DNA_END=489 /DNA_ORIENTATION=-